MPVSPPYFITKENAKALAAKGNQVRWANRSQAEPSHLATQQTVANPELQIDAVRVRKRLDELDKFMTQASRDKQCECPACEHTWTDGPDSREWDNLSRSYERLFRVWMVLTGTPGSGQRKPAPMRTARSQAYPSPEVLPEPLASPVPVQPSTVRPSAGCGPVQPVQDIKSCASALTPPTNTGQTQP